MANKARFDALDYDPKTGKKDGEVDSTPEAIEDEVVDKGQEQVQEEVPEEQKEEVHSNTENTPEDTPEETEDNKFGDFWDHASETLGRQVTKIEDLVVEKEVVKEVEVVKETEYVTEFSKAYDKFFKETNRPVEDFLSANVDVSTLSEEEIVKRSLKHNNPNFDQSDINDDFEDTYGIDEDVMDEREVRRRQLALKKAVNKGTKEIESLKQKFFIPQEKAAAQAQVTNEATNVQIEENRKKWRDAVTTSASDFDGVEIKVSDNFSFKHKASPEDLSFVKEVVSDDTMNTYLNRYKTENGALDTKKMIEDQFFLKNRESIIAETIKMAKEEVRKEMIKQDKHIDFKSNKQKPKPAVLTKRQQEVRDLMSAKYKKR